MTEPFTILVSLSLTFRFSRSPMRAFSLHPCPPGNHPDKGPRICRGDCRPICCNSYHHVPIRPTSWQHLHYNDCHTLHEQNPALKSDMQKAHCFTDNASSSIRLSFLRTTNNMTRKFRDLIVNTKDALKLTAKASQLTFTHKSQSITTVTATILPSNDYMLIHIPCFLLSLKPCLHFRHRPSKPVADLTRWPRETIDPPTDTLYYEVIYRAFILARVIKRQSRLHL